MFHVEHPIAHLSPGNWEAGTHRVHEGFPLVPTAFRTLVVSPTTPGPRPNSNGFPTGQRPMADHDSETPGSGLPLSSPGTVAGMEGRVPNQTPEKNSG